MSNFSLWIQLQVKMRLREHIIIITGKPFLKMLPEHARRSGNLAHHGLIAVITPRSPAIYIARVYALTDVSRQRQHGLRRFAASLDVRAPAGERTSAVQRAPEAAAARLVATLQRRQGGVRLEGVPPHLCAAPVAEASVRRVAGLSRRRPAAARRLPRPLRPVHPGDRRRRTQRRPAGGGTLAGARGARLAARDVQRVPAQPHDGDGGRDCQRAALGARRGVHGGGEPGVERGARRDRSALRARVRAGRREGGGTGRRRRRRDGPCLVSEPAMLSGNTRGCGLRVREEVRLEGDRRDVYSVMTRPRAEGGRTMTHVSAEKNGPPLSEDQPLRTWT